MGNTSVESAGDSQEWNADLSFRCGIPLSIVRAYRLQNRCIIMGLPLDRRQQRLRCARRVASSKSLFSTVMSFDKDTCNVFDRCARTLRPRSFPTRLVNRFTMSCDICHTFTHTFVTIYLWIMYRYIILVTSFISSLLHKTRAISFASLRAAARRWLQRAMEWHNWILYCAFLGNDLSLAGMRNVSLK